MVAPAVVSNMVTVNRHHDGFARFRQVLPGFTKFFRITVVARVRGISS